MDFLLEPADRVDFRHAFDRAQLRQDHPVIERAQIHRRVPCAIFSECAGLSRKDVHVNFAQPRCDRTEFRRHAFRKCGSNRLDSF